MSDILQFDLALGEFEMACQKIGEAEESLRYWLGDTTPLSLHPPWRKP